MRQFFAQGLDRTEQRTGVLIFASVAERYAEIVADAGANDLLRVAANRTVSVLAMHTFRRVRTPFGVQSRV